jgi:hypothetical protein
MGAPCLWGGGSVFGTWESNEPKLTVVILSEAKDLRLHFPLLRSP